jgi:ABC-type bacteriocin/lantibiotic exporter with double-glycine peptidase domain
MNKVVNLMNQTQAIHTVLKHLKQVSCLGSIVACMALSACSTIKQQLEHTVLVTPEQMQQKLSAKLDTPIALMKLFNVKLSHPVITVNAATERLQAIFDAEVSNTLTQQTFQGAASVSGKLRFDEVKHAVLLSEPVIESFNIAGLGKINELMTALVKQFSSELLNDLPLYTLKPEEMKVAGLVFMPRNIAITAAGVKIILRPQ